MINILNIILIILFLVVVPFVLGLPLEKKFIKSGENFMLSRNFILGVVVMLASFGIPAAPFILAGATFKALVLTWVIVLSALIMFSIFTNVKDIKAYIKQLLDSVSDLFVNSEKDRRILIYIVLAIIIFQTSLLIFKMHTDTDDSRFIVEALDALENNSLLRIHPITGEGLTAPLGEMRKDVFASYPIFIGVLSFLTMMKPAVLAHTVFPIFLIPLSYAAMFNLGDYFFGNTKKRTIFMYVLSIVILFSFESQYSLGYTLLTIIWQGRSIYTMVILPFSWYVLMKIYTEDNRKHLYSLFFIISTAAMCLSGTGSLCQIVIAIVFALLVLIRNRDIISAILIGMGVSLCGISSIFYRLTKILRLLGIK